MSYTAPSGSVWQVTNNSDIKAGSNYYKAYSGEYRGDPDQNPKNDMQQSCSFACDSKPDCSGWSLASSGGHCYITGGNNTGLQYSNGNKAYVRTSARPAGIYSTIAQGVTLGYGSHYCQGYSWVSGDSEGQEVQNWSGRWCVENYPRPSRCPAELGTPITGNLVNKTNGAGINYATGTDKLGVVCSYNTVPDGVIFNDSKMATYFGGSSTSGTTQQIRKDRCASFNYSTLRSDTTTCKRFYDAQGAGTYDAELFKRVVAEGPSWIADASKRELVMTCITGASSDLARDATNLFLDRINGVNGRTYQGIAVSNTPSDLKDTWGQNTEVVGFINQLLRTPIEAAGINVPALTQTLAIATIRAYCTSHSDQPACGCVNATKVPSSGIDPLTRCSTTDSALPGCEDLKTLNNKFDGITSPNLLPFVAAIKRAFIPRCYSSSCTAADTGGNQTVLRPDVYQASACNSNLNVCISSISAGRDIKADVNVQQTCAGATGQTYPSELSSVTDRSGETVTAGNGVSPSTSSGPVRDGTTGDGKRTVDGVTFDESDLLIKRGKIAFVDENLETPEKQRMALGGVATFLICCCCLLLILLAAGDDE